MADKRRIEIEKGYYDTIHLDEQGRMEHTHLLPRFFHEYVHSVFGEIHGKAILELGCGGGGNLIPLASRGAVVHGIDISKNVIEHCNKLISESPFAEKITVRVGDIHAMDFPDESFDIIYGHCVLHHVDLETAVNEIHRCLRKGGKGIFVEPLGHNLFITLFRKLTPRLRTPTEKPILFSDYEIFSKKFRLKTKEFFVVSLIGFIPGILGFAPLFEWSMYILYTIEHTLKFDTVFRKQCGYVVLELNK